MKSFVVHVHVWRNAYQPRIVSHVPYLWLKQKTVDTYRASERRGPAEQ